MKIVRTLGTTVIDVGAIMFIIALSGIFGYGIPFERVPDIISGAILNLSTNRFTVLFIIILSEHPGDVQGRSVISSSSLPFLPC
jgi:TRAP-type C4-dicarboxylate transport system permease large subunit